MHIRFIGVLATLALLAGGISPTASAGEETPAAIKETMARLLPGFEADQVRPSPVPGLYEIAYGPNILYMSADARFIIRGGDLLDLKDNSNLTENRRREARREALDALGSTRLIVFSPQEVKHSVTVFTDVDCPYCVRLHRQMSAYNALGIEVRYAAYPRAGIPSESYDKTVSVWCSDDPATAIGRAKEGQPVEKRECENPVADHFATGRLIGVSGTPAIVLEDGSIVPGFVPPDRLLGIIEERG